LQKVPSLPSDNNPPADFFREKFSELEQMFADLPFGYSVLDRELRYLYVSDQLR